MQSLFGYLLLLYALQPKRDVHDYFTGYGSNGVGQDTYGGAGLLFKADQVNKIRHPWLNCKSKKINCEL